MKKHFLPILAVVLASIIALVGLQSVLGELSRLPGLTNEQTVTEAPEEPSGTSNGLGLDGDGSGNGEDGDGSTMSGEGQEGEVPGLLPSGPCKSIVACQCGMQPDVPVFTVQGAANTSLLRSTALTVYDGNNWQIEDDAEYQEYNGEELIIPVEGFSSISRDTIIIRPIIEFTPGFIPTSLYTTRISLNSPLHYYPAQFSFFSKSTFSSSYTFTTTHYEFSTSSLIAGQVIIEEHYLQLPEGLTERTRDLAAQLTSGLRTPYEKAKAIETYLRAHYLYDTKYERAPEGHDPVDWFLFEEQKGVCINFNSAFVVLSRSVGIPARLVTGFAINPTAEEQEVSARQAHAWAETPFAEYGWITFDATPPDNVPLTTEETRKSGIETHTEITATSSVNLKGYYFEVEGIVQTIDGEDVDSIDIEILINETKDKGGTLIGEGQTIGGRFKIKCYLDRDVKVGDYQLIAHARGNEIYAESWSDPEVKVISATSIILELPDTAIVDKPVTIAGTLIEELGDTVQSHEIALSIGGKEITDTLMTDVTGRFTFSHIFGRTGTYTVKAEFRGTEYYLEASATAEIDVMMPTKITLDIPEEALPNELVSIKGYLQDTYNTSIAGMEIFIYVDDIMISGEVTDSNGAFNLEHRFPTVDTHRVEAKFMGFEYYLESSASRLIQILEVVIDITTDDTLIRGEDALIGGKIKTDKGALPHEGLVILFDDTVIAELVSDEHGEFEIVYHVASHATLGQHVIEYRAPGLARTRPQDVLVKSRTFLDVEAPEKSHPGDKLNLLMKLQDDHNNPVRDISIFVEEYYLSGLTDNTGQTQITVEIPDDVTRQSLSLKCTFVGNDLYLPCTEVVEVSLVKGSGFPWWLLAFIPIIGAAAVGGYLVTKRKRKECPPQSEMVPDNVQPLPPLEPNTAFGSLVARIDIDFPQIKNPLPDVWGIGEDLQIECVLANEQGRPLKKSQIEVCIDGQSIEQLVVNGQGKVSFIRTFQGMGEHTVACRFEGDCMYQPARLIRSIRIVDYREEIVGLFAALREWAGVCGVILPPESTPRSIETKLTRQLAGIDDISLDTLVRCFEEADYSIHRIGREQYEEAFLSLARIQDSYGGENEQGA